MQGSADPAALGLEPALAGAGFNAAGVLEAAGYDAQVPRDWRCHALAPGAQSVLVLATGGPSFFDAFRVAPEARLDRDPLDRFTRRVVKEAARVEARQTGVGACAFYFERRGGAYVDLVGLGRSAGLVAPSRLAIGIHARFGPWLAIRALLFTGRELSPTAPDPAFDPCRGCPAPCAAACPGSALPASGFDLAACTSTSGAVAACRVGCAARRACVLGQDHRYSEAGELFHREAALATSGLE